MSESLLRVNRQIDSLCNEFEDAWSSQQQPDIGEFLVRIGDDGRSRLLQALLEVDVELKGKASLPVVPADYEQFGLEAVQHVRQLTGSSESGESRFQLVRELCTDFAREVEQGGAPSVAEYVEKADADSQPALLRNLLHIDIVAKRRQGLVPETMDYVRDLPEHSALISSAFYQTAVSTIQTDQSPETSGSALSGAVRSGNLLGDYRLIRELGRGGMGTVYEAVHTKRSHRVALKILPTVDGRSLQYFKGEFRRMAEINHPNLIGLQSLETDGGFWYFTMDLVAGTDFMSYVRPEGHCDEQRLRSTLPQLAAAVFKLHSENIIHCDLKPSNVMVDHQGRVIALDFGLSFKGGNEGHISIDRIAGTPAYMAPEQAAGRSLTGAADWYAVGVMLYQALTGELPVVGESAMHILQKKQTEAPARCQPPRESLADLAAMADELLQIEPSARPDALEIAGRVSTRFEVPEVSKARTDSILVGRDNQIAGLVSALKQVETTAQPSIVFVSGRSGEGKTSLVEHFLKVNCQTHVCLSGRCYDRESVPFKALDGLIDQLTNHLRSLLESEAALLMPDDVGFLAEVFPVLNRVDVVRKLKGKSVAGLDQQQVRTRAFAALKALLNRITLSSPLVLFADDLQWGDEDSAEAIFQILSGDESPPLMFVGSYRSDELNTSPFMSRWSELTKDAVLAERSITVSPLSIDECTRLAVQLIGEDNASIRQMVFRFASQTGGNPMLFIELVGCYDSASDSFEAVPIEELISRKLHRLPESAKPLLEYLAVAGQRSLLDELGGASGTSQESEAVATAMRSEKLVRITGEGDYISIDTYHDKIREAVLRYLGDDDKVAIHHSLGSYVETAVQAPDLQGLKVALDDDAEFNDAMRQRVFDLSYHFDAAGQTEKAYFYSCLAAQQASKQFSQHAAAEQYGVAKRNLKSNDSLERFRVARGLGRAHMLLGNYELARKELNGATDLSSDPVEQAEVLGLQAQVAHKTGSIKEGAEFYAEAIRRLGYRVPRSLPGFIVGLGYELFVQAIHSFLPDSWYQKKRDLNRAEMLAVELLNRNSIVSYHCNSVPMLWTHLKGMNLAETRNPSLELAYGYGLHPAPASVIGLASRAIRYSEKANQIADQEGDLLTLGHICCMRSMGHYALGELEAGVEYGERGGEYVKLAGEPYIRYLSEIHATLCYWQLGRPQKSIPLGIECFERSLALGENTGMAGSLYILTLAVEGHLPHSALHACIKITEENHFDYALTTQSEGIWHLREGRYRKAIESLERAWSRARQNLVLVPYTISGISWLITAIRAYQEHTPDQLHDEQRILLKKKRTYLRHGRLLCSMCPVAKPHLYREIGLHHESLGNLKKASRWLQKSLRHAQDFGSVLEHSKSVIEEARINAALGQRVDADRLTEAEATLKRIHEETESIVSSKWNLQIL